jgi:hypothetical protein
MEVRGLYLVVGLVMLFGTGMVYGGGGCIPATGEIVCISASDLIDGETVTISDTSKTVVLEFELAQDGVLGVNTAVPLDSTDTASDVSSAIATAINSGPLSVMVLSSGDKVSLVQGTPGPSGNIPILETVADSSFVVTGFSGGECPEIPSVPVLPVPALVVGASSAMVIGWMRRRA